MTESIAIVLNFEFPSKISIFHFSWLSVEVERTAFFGPECLFLLSVCSIDFDVVNIVYGLAITHKLQAIRTHIVRMEHTQKVFLAYFWFAQYAFIMSTPHTLHKMNSSVSFAGTFFSLSSNVLLAPWIKPILSLFKHATAPSSTVKLSERRNTWFDGVWHRMTFHCCSTFFSSMFYIFVCHAQIHSNDIWPYGNARNFFELFRIEWIWSDKWQVARGTVLTYFAFFLHESVHVKLWKELH